MRKQVRYACIELLYHAITLEKECLILWEGYGNEDASWVATAEVTTDALRWMSFNLVLQINVYIYSYLQYILQSITYKADYIRKHCTIYTCHK